MGHSWSPRGIGISGSRGSLAAPAPLIDRDGEQLQIPPVSCQPFEKIQEGVAAHAAVEKNADPVPGNNPAMAAYRTLCFCLEIGKKMGFTEMEP